MLSRMRLAAVALGLVLPMTAGDARAQWDHGGWLWNGWDAKPTASAAAEPAHHAMGAGILSYDKNVRADLVARFNQYAWRSSCVVDYKQLMQYRKSQELKRKYESLLKQLRENPTVRQVENGDALNVALDDLSDPELGPLAARAAKAPAAASLIALVPFRSRSERVNFMLDELRGNVKWPQAFPEEHFADAKKTFDRLVAQMRREDDAGEVSEKTLDEAREFLSSLRAKLATQPLEHLRDQIEAVSFLKTSLALVAVRKSADLRPAIAALGKVTDTSLANLLGFMHAYNLRFGEATTPEERKAYSRLFAILDKARSEVRAERAKEGGAPSAEAGRTQMTDFFHSASPGDAQGETPRGPAQHRRPQ